MIDLSLMEDHRAIRLMGKHLKTLENQQSTNRQNSNDLSIMRKMIQEIYEREVQ